MESKNIAITGCVGCGKTTASNIIKEFGYDVFDVDKFSKEKLCRSDIVRYKLMEFVPQNIIGNQINLKRIGEYFEKDVFAEERFNRWFRLYIGTEIRKRYRKIKSGINFFDIPLLMKMGIEDMFDSIWVIEANAEKCFERVKKRNEYDDLKITDLILKSQSDYDNIQGKIVYVNNNRDICDLKKIIREKIEQI